MRGKFKLWFAGLLSVFLFMAATAVTAATPTQATKKVAAKYLFLIESKHAKFRHLKGDEYQLILPHQDIHSVLGFSERPNRMAFRMQPEKFTQMVHRGDNSFDRDPPNVALSWGDQSSPAEAYELTNWKKSKGMVAYTLKLLNHKAGAMMPKNRQGSVSLFIDDMWSECEPAIALAGFGYFVCVAIAAGTDPV